MGYCFANKRILWDIAPSVDGSKCLQPKIPLFTEVKMTGSPDSQVYAATYLNPVYDHAFPDPFVLKYCGEYWGYCTGIQPDGRCFGLLHSTDLVHWQELGGAMTRMPNDWPFYWAPEVVYHNGKFYLYYSTGDEVNMQMRVAVSTHPAGPFVDSGHRLTQEKFAIDGHVLVDDDGKHYLFYATDFLEHTFVGTGTVRDLMLDPFTLAGQPRPVTRPRYDWHVYEPNRVEKGGVRWHTIEGSFVLKRKGLYYQMFSGGNWQNPSYGVSYATTDSLDRLEEWTQVADGKQVLPILRTIPGVVIGPGHNSVVRGPDNQQLFCVYHRWAVDSSARVMAIDPLDWAGERMLILGPTTTPQPAPILPHLIGFSDKDWQYQSGQASVTNNVLNLHSGSDATAQVVALAPVPCLVMEVSLRVLDRAESLGVVLYHQSEAVWSFKLLPGEGRAVIEQASDEPHSHSISLPPDFDYQAYHLLRLEWDGYKLHATLDEIVARWQGALKLPQLQPGLFSQNGVAAFGGFALTVGWQDLFEYPTFDLASGGWLTSQGEGGWHLSAGQLQSSRQSTQAVISKGPLLENYWLAVNVRLQETITLGGCYGVYPAYVDENEPGPLFTIEQQAGEWLAVAKTADTNHTFGLPKDFDQSRYQQFRFRKYNNQLTIQWETQELGQIAISASPSRIGLYSHQAVVGLEMVRITAF